MKVKKLSVNLLGVNLEMDDLSDVVKISGQNGAGKSRAITALFAALAYKSLDQTKRKALLDSDGEIKVTLDNGYIITRKVKNGKSTIKVEAKDGTKGGQKIIDKFLGTNFVDLGKFLSLSEEFKTSMILESVGLKDKLDEFDEKHKALYDARHDKGKERDLYKVNIEDEVERIEPVDANKLRQEYTEAFKVNNNIDNLEKTIQRQKDEAAQYDNAKRKLKEEIIAVMKKLEENVEQIDRQVEEKNQSIHKLKNELQLCSRVDIDELGNKLDEAEEINQKAEKYNHYADKLERYNRLSEEYNIMTDQLKEIKLEKSQLVADTEFPVKGLSYDVDKGLTFNGHPWISDGQYRTIAFEVARMLKGELNVATFENFSLLDKNAQQEVIDTCIESGFQVFVEIVQDEKIDDDTFFIEDGQLKE